MDYNDEFIYTETTKKALKLMCEKHINQKDKVGLPYILHPFYLASKMKDEKTTTVALLHDLVEDTDVTFDDLSELFEKDIVDAVKLLTHDKDVPYEEYVLKIKENPIARKVKLQDLKHNSNLNRLEKVTPEDIKRQEKYLKAIKLLTE